MELQPPSLHPQFVAAKSLMGDLQKLYLQLQCMKTREVCYKMKKIIDYFTLKH